MLTTAALVFVVGAFAPSPTPLQRDPLLVTPAWLVPHLSDADLVLLHLGDKAEYDARHIPGARHMVLSDIALSDRSPGGLTLQMPPPDDLRQRLAALGISDASRVIVYLGPAGSFQSATRVMFTLDYAGLGDRSSILDGGLAAWTRGGHPVTDIVPAPRTGSLSPLKTRPIVVDADVVMSRLSSPGFVVVDARAPDLYNGVTTGGSRDAPHKPGHITGAKSIPFSEVTDPTLSVRPADALAAVFEAAGVKKGDTVIAYCHIGQQATATLFAARTLGFQVLLYDGSFEDWSRRPDAPVTNPSKK